MDVDALPPGAQVVARDGAIEPRGDDALHELADVRPRAVDDGAQPRNLLVELEHAAELVGDGLRAREVRQRAADGREEARHVARARRRLRRRMRIDVDKPSVHFAISRPAVDRLDRLLERPVVEHGAVEKRGGRGIDAGTQMVGKTVGDEIGPARPGGVALGHQLVHLDDARGRKRAGKRGGRARGEREARRVVEAELALDLAIGAPAIGEMQHVMMVALADQRRIVDLDGLLIAVEIGHRHEQVEGMAGGKERRLRIPGRAHGGHRVVHQARHHEPVERRLEPARAHE